MKKGKFLLFLLLLDVLFQAKMFIVHQIWLVSQTLLLAVLIEILYPSMERTKMHTIESKMVTFRQNLSHYYVFLESSYWAKNSDF